MTIIFLIRPALATNGRTTYNMNDVVKNLEKPVKMCVSEVFSLGTLLRISIHKKTKHFRSII